MSNYKEEPEYLHEYYGTKIPSQGGNAEEMPGTAFETNDKASQNLKNSILQDSVFIKKIRKYDTAMRKGYSVNDSMDFEDANWHSALGKADIVNMYINKNGDVELDIADVYNFNEGEKMKW